MVSVSEVVLVVLRADGVEDRYLADESGDYHDYSVLPSGSLTIYRRVARDTDGVVVAEYGQHGWQRVTSNSGHRFFRPHPPATE